MWHIGRNGKKILCRRKLVEVVSAKITCRTSYIICGVQWKKKKNPGALC